MTLPHRKRRRGQSDEFKALAFERVERLLTLAEEAFAARPDLSDRYVRLAWKLKTRYNLRLPRSLGMKFCRKCFSFWRPGASCRVRVKSGMVTITCLRCGRIRRLPYRAEKGQKSAPNQALGKALIRHATRN